MSWKYTKACEYTTPEGYTALSLAKAKRGPFYVRKFTTVEVATHPDKFMEWGLFSRARVSAVFFLSPPYERLEAYCGSEACANWLAEKWNNQAALLIMTEGTAAEGLIDI